MDDEDYLEGATESDADLDDDEDESLEKAFGDDYEKGNDEFTLDDDDENAGREKDDEE